MELQKFLKTLLATAFTIYLTSLLIPGLSLTPGLKSLSIVTVSLVILKRLVSPVIKILLLPLNIVTFGLIRWLITVIVLYLLDFLLTEIDIQGFLLTNIPGLGKFLPQMVVGTFIATIIIAIVLSILKRTLSWLIH